MDKLTITSAAATLPVTLDEFKAHIRRSGTAEDSWMTACLTAATNAVEKYLEASLVTRTYQLILQSFPPSGAGFRLPYAPVASITSIAYIDGNGVTQTLDAAKYRLVKSDQRAEVWETRDNFWPYAPIDPAAVTVVYVAGFGAAAAVPPSIKLGIMCQAADLYENREWQITGIPVTGVNTVAEAFLHQYRNLDSI